MDGMAMMVEGMVTLQPAVRIFSYEEVLVKWK